MPLSWKPRVVVTGDLFRSFAEDGVLRWTQRPNVAWLEALVRAALPDAEVTALTPESLGLGPAGLMEEQGLPPSLEGWAQAFARPPVGAVATAVAGLRGALVVGFELPPGLASALDAAGACVLNVAIHPVRCLDDLLLSLSAGAEVEPRFADQAVGVPEMRWRLGRMRGRLARERAYAPPVSGRAAVLFGQMRVDRSLFVGGRFVALTDFEDRIRAIAAEYDCLYFRPHPLEAPALEVAEMLARIPGVLVTDRNVYELLDAPDIVAAYGLSSSALYEAALFGKGAEAFIPHPDFGVPPLPRGLALGLDGFARGLASLVGAPAHRFEQPSGALREVVGQSWGLVADATAPLHRQPPELPDREICLANAPMRHAVLRGWRAHEDWGLWSVGPQGTLEFRWPRGLTGWVPVTLKMMAGPSLPGRKPMLTVAAGGEVVYRSTTLEFNEPAVIRFELAPPLHGDRVQIHLFSSDPRAPREIGLNDDADRLGAACFSVYRS